MQKIKTIVLSGIFILFAAVMLDTASVSAASAEATIGSTSYDTLEEAINAVKNGETIKLNKNVSRYENITVNRPGISFTINMNEKKINLETDNYFYLKNGTVTMKNGTLRNPATEYIRTLKIAKGQILKITSGTYKGKITNNGALKISGGTFIPEITNNGTLKISGGSFKCEITNKETMDLSGGTYKAEISNKGTLKITGGTYRSDFDNTKTGTVKISGKAIFKNPCYVSNNGTMKISKATFSGATLQNTSKGKLTITSGTYKNDADISNDSGTVNIKGGTFKSTKKLKDPDGCMIRNIGKRGKMTVSGGTFKATNGRSVFYNFDGKLTIKKGKITYKSTKKKRQSAIMNAGGTLKISGGSVTSNQYGISCMESMGSRRKGTVKISKGTFKTTGGIRYSLLVAGEGGKITVTGGTFKAPKTYLYTNKTDFEGNGKVVLKGGKFSGVKYKKKAGKIAVDSIYSE